MTRELLFNEIGEGGHFMEFDSERAGGFDPLRFAPNRKMVVLGLVSLKTAGVQSGDYLKVAGEVCPGCGKSALLVVSR